MRWTWKSACLRARADTDIMGLTVYAAPYNMGEGGLGFTLFMDDQVLDKVHFWESGDRGLYYCIPHIAGEGITLKTEVDRTFNPYLLGLSAERMKNREQGVALGPVTFLRIMPKGGVGFYNWESCEEEEEEDVPENLPPRFRWTGMRASMNVQEECKEGGTLFLRCAHPDIDKEPVRVDIMSDGDLIGRETFTDHRWEKVVIGAEEVEGAAALTFRVSRTWNPKLEGVSEDGRDLGVAVGIRVKNGP